jgi:hypothetical protein
MSTKPTYMLRFKPISQKKILLEELKIHWQIKQSYEYRHNCMYQTVPLHQWEPAALAQMAKTCVQDVHCKDAG